MKTIYDGGRRHRHQRLNSFLFLYLLQLHKQNHKVKKKKKKKMFFQQKKKKHTETDKSLDKMK